MNIYLKDHNDINNEALRDYIVPCAEQLIHLHNEFTQKAAFIRTADIMMPLFIFISTVLLRIKKDDVDMDSTIDEFSVYLKKFYNYFHILYRSRTSSFFERS